MRRNRSFVFFRLVEDFDPLLGPVAGAGVALTPLRSIAVDRAVWSYGLPFWIEADLPWADESARPFRRLMIAQDTGSAIVGPARADIFFGSGGRGRRARRGDPPSRAHSPCFCLLETSREGGAADAPPEAAQRRGDRALDRSRARGCASPRGEPAGASKPLAPRAPAPPPAEAAGPPRGEAAKPRALPLAPIERRLKRELARGRGAIDGALDLHGMNQVEAHQALRGFLRHSQARGARLVIVVTGKGGPLDEPASFGQERGVLRRLAPHWLREPDLRSVVLGFEEAGRAHGGSGALFVRLRRP